METEEYQKEYSKRPCVKGPFITLKEFYHIEQEVVIRKTKNRTKNKPRRTSIQHKKTIQPKRRKK